MLESNSAGGRRRRPRQVDSPDYRKIRKTLRRRGTDYRTAPKRARNGMRFRILPPSWNAVRVIMRAKAMLRDISRSALFAAGYHASRASDLANVRGLIEKLRPLDCGVALIRVGSEGDGGYLIPDDLSGVEYCMSPGVSDLAEFESQLAERKIKSFLADYSVASPPLDRKEFAFDKKFVGATNRDPFFTLATWKERHLKGYAGDLLLQMDIESWEYETILGTPDALLRQFRILVIEFHELDKLFDAFDLTLMSSCFEKILQFFYVVHIHPNNCSGVVRRGGLTIPRTMEITFLNKVRAKKVAAQTEFPHPLDADCCPKLLHVALPKCWYS